MRKETEFYLGQRRSPASAVAVLLLSILAAAAGNQPTLSVSRAPAGIELSWPGVTQKADGSTDRPYFELQRSADLRHWQPIGQRMRAPTAQANQALALMAPAKDPFEFYRLLSFAPPAVAKLATGGEAVFGYADAFGQELQRVGQISPDRFAALFPNKATYLHL